mmetsp:Transcript_1098/g.3139  ORF Transcript_1098/g.3139 Transcript_1098/m.3139 type:complete len:231 (-) Transcript_1098:533-1225(-)
MTVTGKNKNHTLSWHHSTRDNKVNRPLSYEYCHSMSPALPTGTDEKQVRKGACPPEQSAEAQPMPALLIAFSAGSFGIGAENLAMFARGPASALVMQSMVFDRVSRLSAEKLMAGELLFLFSTCLPMQLRALSRTEMESASRCFGNLGPCENSWTDWVRRLLRCCVPRELSLRSCLPGPTSAGFCPISIHFIGVLVPNGRAGANLAFVSSVFGRPNLSPGAAAGPGDWRP